MRIGSCGSWGFGDLQNDDLLPSMADCTIGTPRMEEVVSKWVQVPSDEDWIEFERV